MLNVKAGGANLRSFLPQGDTVKKREYTNELAVLAPTSDLDHFFSLFPIHVPSPKTVQRKTGTVL